MSRIAFGEAPVCHLRYDDRTIDEQSNRHDQCEQDHHVDRGTECPDQQDAEQEAAGDRDADEQRRANAEDADDDDEHEQHCREHAVLQLGQHVVDVLRLVARHADLDVAGPLLLLPFDDSHDLVYGID